MIDESDSTVIASRFESGKYVGKLNPLTEKEAHSVNGKRKLSVDCYVEETQHWTDWYQYGYGYLGSTYEGSTFTEVCFEEGESGDTGGGGSGTTYREYSDRTAPDNFLSMAPEFKYPPDSNYEDLYPKLTEYLRNQIPNLAYNDYIISALEKYGDLSSEQIKEHLKWGNGPTIEIVQLANACDTCNNDTYGLFRTTAADILYLDLDLVLDLEESEPGTELADAFSFLVGVTLLHEYVHFSEWSDGSWNSPESGLLFEEDVYGMSIWRHNVEDFMMKYKKNNE